MNRHKRDVSILGKIVKYCDEIAECIARFGSSYDSLLNDRAYQNATAMCVLQIGELAGHLSDDFRGAHPEMPWQSMKAMRNIAAHNYESFDMITLWNTISRDIPALREYCLRIIEQETGA